jgi:hypothetical protein
MSRCCHVGAISFQFDGTQPSSVGEVMEDLVFLQKDEDPVISYKKPQFESSLTMKGNKWSTNWFLLGDTLNIFLYSVPIDSLLCSTFSIKITSEESRDAKEMVALALLISANFPYTIFATRAKMIPRPFTLKLCRTSD